MGAEQTAGAISGRVRNAETSRYVVNAKVSIAGTGTYVLTDEFGTYHLNHVPVGAVTLEVFYTGLAVQQQTVTVAAGQTIESDIDLTARPAEPNGVVTLAAMVVGASRETNAEAIAVNEQRFAPNIKNVLSADSFGDMMDGNVGEFLKFIPGVTGSYDLEMGNTVSSVSLRGLPTGMTNVSSDGLQMANTGNAQGNSREFQFGQVSLNNLARLEVTKVPTPSSPADSMAGSVNMVTKSAFERKDAQLLLSASLTATDGALTFHKSPTASDRKIYKIRPNFTFDYTLPVTRDFGLVVTAATSNRYMHQTPLRRNYNFGGSGNPATLTNPYLQSFQFVSAPRLTSRDSLGLRADWRVARNNVVSVSAQASRFDADRSSFDMTLDAGANGTPSIAGGTALSYTPEQTIGATGRGAVNMMGTSSVEQELKTFAENLRYRFDNGDWQIDASLGTSRSAGGYQDTVHGHVRQLGLTMAVPVRVTLSDITSNRPRSWQVFDNTNRPVDPFDSNNYRLSTANSTPRAIIDQINNAKLDVRKAFAVGAVPIAAQVGGLQRIHVRDTRRESINWTYNGMNGNFTPTPYRDTVFVNQDNGFGFKNVPWISEYKVWEDIKANTPAWTKTAAQVVAEETFRLNNSEYLRETVSAGYVQGEARFLQNRLKLLTGVRFEKTKLLGQGVLFDPNAIFQRDTAGKLQHDAAGRLIRRADAGAAGSLQELALLRKERAAVASGGYDGYYPSLHLTFDLRENLLVRASYAKTYGRPELTNIIPNTSINEADLTANPNSLPGTISVRNTGLRPWTADNYDLALEYYTAGGGLFSVGGFVKDIRDFFGASVRIATAADLQEVGLDPGYAGWQLSTRYNLPGTARVVGGEFNVKQTLQYFGAWGRQWSLFANGTKLRLEGDQDADFADFLPTSLNAGVTFSTRRGSVMAKWNYRGQQKQVANTAVRGFDYIKSRSTLDLGMNVTLPRRLVLFLNVQNVFNAPETLLRYGPLTPKYSYLQRETSLGVDITLGLRGTF